MIRARVALLGTLVLLSLQACTPAEGPSGHASDSPGTGSAAGPSAPRTSARSAPPRIRVSRASWHLPQAMSRGVVVPVAGGAVVAGGLLPGDVSTAKTYRLALPAGRWRQLPPLPTAAHDAAGALLGGRPAVVGGGGATELSTVQVLGSDGAWHTAGRLPGARSDLATVSSKKVAVVIGGYDGVTSPRKVLRTVDGRRFTTLGALPHGVRYAAVVVVGRTAWVLGGEQDDRELRSVDTVDLRSGHVRRAGRLPRPLGHASAVVVGDRILLMGGRTSPHRPTDAMWWFRPSTRTWRRAGRLPYPVADAPTVVAGRTAYLLGGETPAFTDRVVTVAWR